MKINVTNNNKVGGVTVSTSPSVDKVSLKSGAPGPVGLTGAQGIQGAQGLQGSGAQGAQGAQGSGSQGIQGPQGLQGLQGIQGIQGTIGVQGASYSTTISTTPPVSANAGDTWWDSESGIRFVYYNDGTSSQWVQESHPSGGITNPYNQPFTFSNTTASTSNTTGALIVSGGLGVAGNTNIAGNVSIARPDATQRPYALDVNGPMLFRSTGNPTNNYQTWEYNINDFFTPGGSTAGIRAASGKYYGTPFSSGSYLQVGYNGVTVAAAGVNNGSQSGIKVNSFNVSPSIADAYSSKIADGAANVTSTANTTLSGYYATLGDYSANTITNTLNGIYVDVGGGNNAVSIRNAGVFLGGNVGIGTSTPNTKLHVDGSIFANGRITFASQGSNQSLYFDRISSNYWTFNSNNGVGEIFNINGNLLTIPQDVQIGRGGLTVQPTLTTGGPAANAVSITPTWNNVSTTFIATKVNVTDTASASGSLLADWQVGGTSRLYLDKNARVWSNQPTTSTTSNFVAQQGASGTWFEGRWGASLIAGRLRAEAGVPFLDFSSGGAIRWYNNFIGSGTLDATLLCDGANAIAQRSGTSPQISRIYATYTDASNYARIFFDANSGAGSQAIIGAEGAGTGSNLLNLAIKAGSAGGTRQIIFNQNGSDRWKFDASSHFVATTDNAYDIGNAGALRPRNVYIAGNVAASNISLNTSSSNTTSIAANGYNILGTDATPMVNLAGTWNTTGVPTALKLNITDTASAATANLIDLQVNASSKFSVNKAGGLVFNVTSSSGGNPQITLGGTSRIYTVGGYTWIGGIGNFGTLDNNFFLGSTGDVVLARDAADTLAQRRSTANQTLRIYNTYTDASNYERATIGWSGNILQIGTANAGTGVARALELQSNGTTRLTISALGSISLTPPAGQTVTLSSNRIFHYSAGAAEGVSFGNYTGGHGFIAGPSAQICFAPSTAFAGNPDVGFQRHAVNVVKVTNGSTGVGVIQTPATTVAALPAAATAGAGARSFVTDATDTTFLSIVVGGGTTGVPVVSNGTNWLIG